MKILSSSSPLFIAALIVPRAAFALTAARAAPVAAPAIAAPAISALSALSPLTAPLASAPELAPAPALAAAPDLVATPIAPAVATEESLRFPALKAAMEPIITQAVSRDASAEAARGGAGAMMGEAPSRQDDETPAPAEDSPVAPSAAYRGVEKAGLISSLKRAETFLRRLDLGPATAKSLDAWLEMKPFEAISSARNDAGLAKVMQKVGYAFLRFHEVFRHHALSDIAGDRADAGAAALYRDLYAWGAFSRAHSLEYAPIDAEMGIHLGADNAGRLTRTPEAIEAGADRLREIVAELERDNPRDARWLGRAIPLILAARARSAGRAAKAFMRMNLHQRHLVDKVLDSATGLQEGRERLAVKSPIGRYGIAFESSSNKWAELQKELEPTTKKALEILDPFHDTDEIGMTAIGRITEDRAGFIFTGTRRAAQALADAMPGQTVIDGQGRRIEPRRKASGD